ncbi:MAG TPA: NRAMP family divalent metal transporter [Gemmatimonadaceae bacterium]|nr:NRAMP family divalent metal transporter [Gemmatimonadaceae bacterium]
MTASARRSTLVGAAFLMATSAVGPGFLTQTAVFTQRLAASFAFAILVSVIVDLVAQLNIWRVLTVTGQRAQDVANRVLPGLGWVLAFLVALGGLAFNIGNIAGTGLGVNVLFGLDARVGALISAVVAIVVFVLPQAGRAMDRFAQALGLLMIALALYVAVASDPPYASAAREMVLPARVDLLAIVTIVGGTVGGYITFAGAHRLIDAGITGPGHLGEVTRSATLAIGVATVMRVILFLGALGVVAKGVQLAASNPPADVFRQAAGEVGYRLFGVVMWAAAITSVVGSAYTSVSFLRSLAPAIERNWRVVTIAFIVVSTIVFLVVGRPVRTLVAVGALNALILPLSLGAMLLAANKRAVVGDYRHPVWLTASGWIVALAMAAMGAYALVVELPKIWKG